MGSAAGRPDVIAHDDGTLSVVLVPYDPSWPARFADLAAGLRGRLPVDVGIHHVGSTAVPGLAAKPRIDVQVSVPAPLTLDAVAAGLTGVGGLASKPVGDDRRKRLLVTHTPVAAHVHVRRAGELSGQAALLLRDFLRADDAARDRYRAVKERLAARRWVSVDAYADAKGDVVWSLLRAADSWAAASGWQAPPSDG